jgi:hypothetical protein
VAAAAYVSWTVGERDALRLHSHAHDIRAALEARMDAHIALLRAGTGLFAASDEVSRDEFRRFAEQLACASTSPGCWASATRAGCTPAAGARARAGDEAAGHCPDFRVWPPGPTATSTPPSSTSSRSTT